MNITKESDIVPFHTYLWKIASRCNINCTYCYIYNLADTRWREQPKFMSEKVARQTAQRIREHCEKHDKKDIVIIFHGGEPLLGGVSHLKMLVSVIRETLAGLKVSVGMQSNGLLFTEEIGDFLKENRISIGVSIDGPPEVNDIHRLDHQGRPTSAQLEEKIQLLTSRYRSIFAGFLCVVNIKADPVSVIKYLLSFSPPSFDLILPYNNYDNLPEGKETDLSATPYGDWLIRCFDYWYKQNSKTRIRYFSSYIRLLFGAPGYVESMGLDPIDLIVVETNGEIEGVDSLKSTYDGATKLGYNIFDHDFDAVATHFAVRSRQLGAKTLCQKCQECGVVNICGGGYIPNRYSSENGFNNSSVYCSDLEKVIRHLHSTVSQDLVNIQHSVNAQKSDTRGGFDGQPSTY
jgi:uncharacterized protein